MVKKLTVPRLIGILSVLLFLCAMFGSASFQSCASGLAVAGQNQDSGSGFFSFVNNLITWSRFNCVGAFIHDAHEEILAAFTVLLALVTLYLWSATSDIAADARKSAIVQGDRMEKSILEATRAADGMRDVALATKENAALMQGILHKQMRAYVSVETGVGIYQDANNRFAGNPVITNTGFTPARNVSYTVKAAILTIENIPPQNLVIPPDGDIVVNDAGIAPRQQFTISGVVENRFSDEEVKEIMNGGKKRLFVWGFVTYDDIFDGSWRTDFCHNYIFIPVGEKQEIKFFSYYHCTHNNAT